MKVEKATAHTCTHKYIKFINCMLRVVCPICINMETHAFNEQVWKLDFRI